jgi:acyl carrier protein
MREKLPEYMVPAYCVVLDAFPLTPHGKVDRRALSMLESWRDETDEHMITAQTPLEEMVLAIYREILGREQISIHENFFDLGGHSLLATQVIARLRAAIGIELSVRSLFEAPSVAALARQIEQNLRGEQERVMPPLVPVTQEQDLPLSFAQQRLWFQEQLASGYSAYVLPIVVRLHGPLHVAVLERSLLEIVRRHESLRTTFVAHSGQPVQIIHAALHIPLAVIDLQRADEKKQTREVFQMLSIGLHQPFNLSQGPLIRMGLLCLQEQEHIFYMMVHHIAFDGWSTSIFLRELSMLYEAFVQGRPSPLPPLALQYADVALWQRNWLEGAVLKRLLNYWTKQLTGAVPLQMPTDRPRRTVVSDHGAIYPLILPAPLGQELMALSREVGVTLFMTLLTAFQILLYRWTGQQDIVVGTDSANRTEISTEQIIGFFVNLLALRVQLSPQATFRDIVRRVCATVLDACAHQDLPFDQLVNALQLERKPAQIPLINVLFVLNNIPQSSLTLPGVTVNAVDIEVQTAKFDVALFLMERGQEIVGYVNYRTDLFDLTTIVSLICHFKVLLQSIVAGPDLPVGTLEMLTEQEKEQALSKEKARAETKRSELKNMRRRAIIQPPER